MGQELNVILRRVFGPFDPSTYCICGNAILMMMNMKSQLMLALLCAAVLRAERPTIADADLLAELTVDVGNMLTGQFPTIKVATAQGNATRVLAQRPRPARNAGGTPVRAWEFLLVFVCTAIASLCLYAYIRYNPLAAAHKVADIPHTQRPRCDVKPPSSFDLML